MSDLQEITGLFTNEAIQVMAEAYDVALDVSFQKGRSRNKYMYLVQRKKIYKKKHFFFSQRNFMIFFYFWFSGNDGGLDFGTVKVGQEEKLTCHLKNKGKFEIQYK